MSVVAYIGFGANLGDRESMFYAASDALSALPGTVVTRRSRVYKTEPVGLSDQGPSFLNAVIEVKTDLAPVDLMAAMRKIELDLGKDPGHKSDRSRVVDLDLLLYGHQTVRQDDLRIPHPRMHTRAFVLIPLAELAPDVSVPSLDRSIRDLMCNLSESEKRGVTIFQSNDNRSPWA